MMMMLTSGFDLVFVVVVVERVRVVVEESGGNGVYQKYNQLKNRMIFCFCLMNYEIQKNII